MINILIPQPKIGVAVGFFLTQVLKVKVIFGSALRLWAMVMDGRELIF